MEYKQNFQNIILLETTKDINLKIKAFLKHNLKLLFSPKSIIESRL